MIILFGLAGSGKGTQSKALSEIFGWRWISTGQLIRDSGKFNSIIDKGNMITDADMEKMLEKELDITDKEGYDIILDGFPRSKAQAEWLLSLENHPVDGAIILDVPKDELYQRLYMRAGLDGRVDDQEKSTIERRFEVFEQNIYSILPLFEAKNIPVVHVDGVGDPGEVTDRLVDVVKTLAPNATEQNDDVNGEEIEKSYGE
ncbi:nucleoside monophosphate kinase [Candidatus Saccharibacteria bacterium]|nr:nucleoside monophosphate kinase [Candidatus Saccharibacteria bacterium]